MTNCFNAFVILVVASSWFHAAARHQGPPGAAHTIESASSGRGGSGAGNNFCRKLHSLGGGKKPLYFLVVARRDEDISWVSQLPIPSIVYSLEANATVDGVERIGPLTTPAAAFAQAIVDHYECLPPWTLFLSARGRTSFSGSTERGGFNARHSSSSSSSQGAPRRPPRATGASNGGPAATTSSARQLDGTLSSPLPHPLPPAISSAVLDVERMDSGFVAVGHLSEFTTPHPAEAASSPSHPAVAGFSLHAPRGSHRMDFVSVEEKRRGCSCAHLKLFLGKRQPCERPWGWPRGGEFWASDVRLRLRPLDFWRHILSALVLGESLLDQLAPPTSSFAVATSSAGSAAKGSRGGNDDDAGTPFPFAVGATSPSPSAARLAQQQLVEARAACFETVWHHLLGEHLYHYQPLYEFFEAMPITPFTKRCEDGRRRMSGVCSSLKVPSHSKPSIATQQPFSPLSSGSGGGADAAQSKEAASAKCLATHGEMLGETLLVTTYAGVGVQDSDHSCCRKCRSTPRCSFWVRATDSQRCWLKAGFVGYGSASNRRGMFISEFNGIFLAESADVA